MADIAKIKSKLLDEEQASERASDGEWELRIDNKAYAIRTVPTTLHLR